MNILGLSAYYHDSAACLVRDGRLVAAAQEERFTRRKHDAGFPRHAVRYCLAEGGVGEGQLDAVVFYDKPLTKFVRILKTSFAVAPRGLRPFLQAMPVWLREKLWIPAEIERELRAARGRQARADPLHRASRGARGERVLRLAVRERRHPHPRRRRRVGDQLAGRGSRSNRLRILEEIHFPHSLGLLYSAFTYYTGFKVNSGEYKLMGLAPYGEPRYVQQIYDHLLDLRADGSFRLNLDYFGYADGLRMTNRRFDELFGGPPRESEGEITRREMDLARSIQEVTEEVVLRMARHAHAVTGEGNLCLAGGVALNCVANGRVLREGPFADLWIQPASGDAGGAVGAALYVWHMLDDGARILDGRDRMEGAFLGPAFSDADDRRLARPPRDPLHDPGRRRARARGRAPHRGRGSGGPLRGPHGVRPARPRQPFHRRRRAVAAHAVAAQPEDQVPRVVPALRALGAGRAVPRVLRAGPRLAVHAAGRPGGARAVVAAERSAIPWPMWSRG